MTYKYAFVWYMMQECEQFSSREFFVCDVVGRFHLCGHSIASSLRTCRLESAGRSLTACSYMCNSVQILTGAEVNTDKLCPEVVQCCPRAEGPRVTLHN